MGVYLVLAHSSIAPVLAAGAGARAAQQVEAQLLRTLMGAER